MYENCETYDPTISGGHRYVEVYAAVRRSF
jgi:hypothetical protein